ncbi:hypothetical protein ABN034_11560 [Actinopolymorpha sp. B11F2]|uniref:hypothetical protein n=1 Tax=Actinopolymorpha sp. B11F2 TaxID=3160862 RepID=UPI0032E48131
MVQNRSSGSGGGLFSFASEVAANDSKINANSIASPDGSGGGIHSIDSDVRLTDTTVNKNLSTEPPGGCLKEGGTAEIDDKSEITKNRPSNCADSGDPVENCFG